MKDQTKIQTLFSWLDGKKTLIGGTLLGLSAAASGTLPAIPFLGALPAIAVLAPAAPWLALGGVLMGGVGTWHKIQKALTGAEQK